VGRQEYQRSLPGQTTQPTQGLVVDLETPQAAHDRAGQDGQQALRPPAAGGGESGDVPAQPPPVPAPDLPAHAVGTPGTAGRPVFPGVTAQDATRVPASHVAAPSALAGSARPAARAMVRPYRSFVPVGRADGVQKDRGMDENSAFAAISALISTQFSVPEHEIRPETPLADLGLDSVGLVELAALLEDEFDIDVTSAAVTMQDRIGDLVRRLCAGSRPSAAR
jgi:acyl carrier protein